MAHIVVIGAGIGGMPAGYEIKALLGKKHEVTVINTVDFFQFTPSNPWVGLGWRKREDITLPIAPYLKKKGINFISQAVTKIEPERNRLTLENNETVSYDYLVITTGPKLAFEEVTGLGPKNGYTQSVCQVGHAELAYERYQALLDNPGPVIMGAVGGASCYGPAYEYMLAMEYDLRTKKRRKDVPMTFVTSEPFIGHLGLGGVGDTRSLLESEFRSYHIDWITNAKVTKVEDGKMYIDQYSDKGEVIESVTRDFHYSMMLPAFKGVDVVAAVEGLCNPRGFVIVNDYQRNPTHPNIFSAGVCIAIPPVDKNTPVPVGTPKTGYMIESMVTAIAHNIHNEVNGKKANQKGSWSAICLADMGDRGAAFVAIPQIPPRNITWSGQGKWVHMAKIAFEKYFLRKMKKGSSEPLYEKYVLQALGLKRLDND